MQRQFLSVGGVGPGSGISTLPSLSTGSVPGLRRLARQLEYGSAGAAADSGRGAGSNDGRRLRVASRGRRAATSSAVRRARRGAAEGVRAIAPGASGQAAHTGNRLADDRGGLRLGIRKRSALQRGVSADVRTAARRLTKEADRRRGACRRSFASALIRATLRLDGDDG